MSGAISTLSYLSRRLAAYLSDAALLFAGVVATQMLLLGLGRHPFHAALAAGVWPDGRSLHLWVLVSASAPVWFYFAGFQSSAWQATPGQRWLGLRVTDLAGGRLSFGRALVRAVVTLIPFEVNHFVLLQLTPAAPGFAGGLAVVYGLLAVYLGALVASARRQSVPDWLVASQVIRVGPA
mgnify:CR=1 FL=1